MRRSRVRSGQVVHVRQRKSNDCVIATAAIVANVPYDVAASRSPIVPGTRGLYAREALDILEAVTGIRWRGPGFGWFRSVAGFADEIIPLILIAGPRWQRRVRHCVAVMSGWVFDPEIPEGCLTHEYDRRRWQVLEAYRPADADRLCKVQEDRFWKRCIRLD